MSKQLISYLQDTGFDLYDMREWLSGGAPPCQGGGRGFDPRLALEKITIPNGIVIFFEPNPGLESSMSTLRFGPRNPRSPGPRAPSRAYKTHQNIYLYSVSRCISKLEGSMSTLHESSLFFMHMSAGPDFTGLSFIGGAAEE